MAAGPIRARAVVQWRRGSWSSSILPRRYLREYVRWLWPYRFAIFGLFLLSVASAGLDVLWPLSIKCIIDLLGSSRPDAQKFYLLNVYGAVIVVVMVGRQSLDVTQGYRSRVLGSKVTFRLRKRLFERLVNLPLAELAEMKSGGIVSRLSSDVDGVGGLIDTTLISPVVSLIRILLILTVLCFLSCAWQWRCW